MKQFKFLTSRIWVYITCILMTILGTSLAAEIDPFILEAYQLRMSGKANQAEELLKLNLEKDSTNAFAWFELARTRNHILLGQGRIAEWGEVMDLAQKSVNLDPDNEIFAFFMAYCRLTDSFISLMQGKPDAKDKTNTAGEAFKRVLQINPNCYAAELYLMDIYALLPEEMGGDKEMAAKIADGMKSQEAVYYAMAQTKLMPENADLITFWQNFAKDNGTTAQVMEELGRAFLVKSDAESGKKYYMDAANSDPAKRYLNMNLVRFYLMSLQQDQANKDEYLKEATELVNSYIEAVPAPVAPLKAHAYSILAMISSFNNDQEAAKKFNDMADSIDPYCSKASGMPPHILYAQPDKISLSYSSFFMPF